MHIGLSFVFLLTKLKPLHCVAGDCGNAPAAELMESDIQVQRRTITPG